MEIGRQAETIQNYSMAKINQNTEKSPGDLRRIAVTQTPVKDYQLMLTRSIIIIIIIIIISTSILLEIEKDGEHESDIYTNYNRCSSSKLLHD